jgi:hypothetical protein
MKNMMSAFLPNIHREIITKTSYSKNYILDKVVDA